MKWLSIYLLCSLALLAQPRGERVTGTYTFDANGNKVPVAESRVSKGDGSNSSIEMQRNLNGDLAPLEKVEERVVSKSSTVQVTERLVRSYDANGNPAKARKTVTTVRKNADGSESTEDAVYNGDLNGGFSLFEKQQKVSRTTGDVTKYETVVTRATLNGEELVEQQHGTIIATKEKTREDVIVDRRDLNGNLQLAGRSTVEREETDGIVKEKAATYSNEDGQLRLFNQTVSETQTGADGSSVKRVNVYGASSAGQAISGTPQFREQQIVEKKIGPANSMTETLSIRRPDLSSGSLGPAVSVSERTCTGQCNTP